MTTLKEKFQQDSNFSPIKHEMIGAKIMHSCAGLTVHAEVIAAFENVQYKGKQDAHIVFVTTHEGVNWGGTYYTSTALWLHEDGRGDWFEVEEVGRAAYETMIDTLTILGRGQFYNYLTALWIADKDREALPTLREKEDFFTALHLAAEKQEAFLDEVCALPYRDRGFNALDFLGLAVEYMNNGALLPY